LNLKSDRCGVRSWRPYRTRLARYRRPELNRSGTKEYREGGRTIGK
jgi:hypothetical protein